MDGTLDAAMAAPFLGGTVATRIVVTGRGVMSAIGTSIAAFEANLLQGNGGIRACEAPGPGQTAHLGLVAGFDAALDLDRLVPEGCDRTARLAADAALQALREARLWAAGGGLTVPGESVALLLGSSHGGRSQLDRFVAGGMDADDPQAAQSVIETAAHAHQTASVAALLGINGPVLTLSTACSSSGTAIAHGLELLRGGHARVVLAGGADAFSQLTLAGFQALGAVADAPCGPFGSTIGISLGEGSAFVVLERLDDAMARGAAPLAEIFGCATSWDAHHLTAPEPSGDGMRRAIEESLAISGLAPSEIDYVNAHGTGTRANDIAETLALKRVFADRVPPISATKSFTGHTLGASSAAGLLAGIAGLRADMLPPTLNFGAGRAGCHLDYVPDVARPQRIDRFLALSAAFGGCNCAIAAGRLGEGAVDTATARHRTGEVVVTGIGVISPLGCDPLAAYEAWLAGAAGWQAGADSAKVQGFDAKRHLPRGRMPRMNLVSQYAVAAVEQALSGAGLVAQHRRPAGIGLMVGLSRGAASSFQAFMESVAGGDWGRASPSAFPHMVMSSVGGQVAVAAGLKGAASTLVGEAEAGLALVGQAASLLAIRPDIDAVVVLAADEVAPLFLQLQHTLRPRAPLPLAEGAVALVVERAETAAARNAAPLAHIAGWAQSFDSAPDALGADAEGRWLEQAMRSALQRAQLLPAQLGLALTMARGEMRLDLRDTAALGRVFGNRAPPVTASAGHAGWAEASGSLFAVAMALLALRHGRIAAPAPALGNLGAPFLTAPAEGDFASALVAGSSRHGNNAALLLRRPDRLAA